MKTKAGSLHKENVNKCLTAYENGEWHSPPPYKWLLKKKWNPFMAILLFSGLDVTPAEIKWRGLLNFAELKHINKLGSEYIHDLYSFYSKEQLENEIKSNRKEAENCLLSARNDFIMLTKSNVVPSFCLNNFIDQDIMKNCKRWLKYYEESERIFNIIVEEWITSEGTEAIVENDKRLEYKEFYFQWAVNSDITQHIPWWPDFELEFPHLMPKSTIAHENSSEQHNKEYTGWIEIIAAWASLGQKKVSPRQMRNYKKEGLRINYKPLGAKKIPTVTANDLRDFIFKRTSNKSKKK
ncbi:hypothetical protein [Desulfosediminicola ganghwensis]|uniref:hypothetical protein n=1 Tax=Desulfosediminicola ganghwensis TaxID=2569540 RepID=UPI0010ABBBCB|nr:hypothetical protein [Desulfosediminicola ganghwensis]